MHCEPTGRGTYIVTSNGEDFNVDVLACDGNGVCDCWHYKRTLSKAIEQAKSDGVFKPGARFKCPHLVSADEHFLLFHKKLIIEMYGDGDDSNHP